MSSQLARIERNRKPAEERPVMMNRNSGAFMPIDSAMQDWSIAADDALKHKAITNLETTKTQDADKIRRRTKLTGAFANARLGRITQDVSIHSSKVKDVTSLVGEIRSVSIDGAASVPADITDMVSDMRQGILDVEHRARNSQFIQDMVANNLKVENFFTQNVAEVQRTKAWAPILQNYSGLE